MKFTIIVAKITLDKLSLVITMKNGTRAIHAIIDIPGIGKERTNKNDLLAVERSKVGAKDKALIDVGRTGTRERVAVATAASVATITPALAPQKTIQKTKVFQKTRVKQGGRLKPLLIPGFKLDAKDSFNLAFDVQVRRGGVFRTVAGGLTRSEALSFGAKRVKSTAAATFRIKESGLTGRFGGLAPDLKTFERRPRDTFVEKRGERISSFGELREITFKGLRTLKFKRAFKL